MVISQTFAKIPRTCYWEATIGVTLEANGDLIMEYSNPHFIGAGSYNLKEHL